MEKFKFSLIRATDFSKKKEEYISIILSRAVNIFFVFGSIKFITNQFDEEVVGKYYLIMTIISLINLSVLNAPSNFFFRNFKRFHNQNLFNNVLKLAILLGCIASFLSLLPLSFFFKENLKSNSFLIFVICIYIALDFITRNSLNVYLTLRKFKKFNRFNFFYYVLSLIFGMIFSKLLNTLYGFFIGLIISQLVIVCSEFKSIDSNLFLKSKIYKPSKPFFDYIFPLIIANFFIWGNSQGFRILIENYFSLNELGLISIVLFITNGFLSNIESLFSSYYNPKIFLNYDSSKFKSIIENYIKNISFVIIVLSFFVVNNIEFLISLIGKKTYLVFKNLVYFSIVSEYLRIITNILKHKSFRVNKTKLILHANIFSFCLTIVTFYILFNLEFNLTIVVGSLLIVSNLSLFVYMLVVTDTKNILKLIFYILILVFISLINFVFKDLNNSKIYFNILIFLIAIIYLKLKFNEFNYTRSRTS